FICWQYERSRSVPYSPPCGEGRPATGRSGWGSMLWRARLPIALPPPPTPPHQGGGGYRGLGSPPPPPPPQGGGELPTLWLLLALASPAVFVNLGHGHNGFLTAALIGFALVQLDKRPGLGGICFARLATKPQFGLMIPLVLIATGRWRTVFAAAATVALLALGATLAF